MSAPRRAGVIGASVALVAALLAGCDSSSKPSSSASSGPAKSSPIVLGVIADLTGSSSSTFADGPGAAQARVDLQNAQGGVNGHPLKLIVEDDQSSPTQALTAAQDLVSKGAFGVIGDTAFLFGAAKYLNQHGIPTTGCDCDGPEWGLQPYTNMFAQQPPTSSSIGGTYYTYTYQAELLKSIGVTRLAGLGYGISPSSPRSIKELYAQGKQLGGISRCYANYSVPFGAVDFTADALQIKQSGCNGVVGSFVDSSDVALAQAVKNAGINAQQFYFTGYDNNVLQNPGAREAFQNVYVESLVNFTTPNAATKTMVATLEQYDKSFKGGIPDLGIVDSYLAADLMIFGLEHAGKNLTRGDFISNLRNVSSYNAGGILPTAVSFRNFATEGMLPKTDCFYMFQFKGSSFVDANGGKPTCGTLLAVPGI